MAKDKYKKETTDGLDEYKVAEKETAYELYMRGKQFNEERGLFTSSKENYDFYYGNQWDGFESGDLNPIVLNIIEPIVDYKVGIVGQNDIAIIYKMFNEQKEDMKDVYQEALSVLNETARKTIEFNHLNNINKRKLLKRAGIDAESVLYSYFDEDKKMIITEVIPRTNIFYGNESESDIQAQPYIITVKRLDFKEAYNYAKDMVSKGKMEEDDLVALCPDEITLSEKDTDRGKEEVNDGITFFTKFYRKSDGKVYFQIETKNVTVRKESDTKLELYPIEHMLWEEVIDSARGMGIVSPLINNQIEINKTAMRRMIAIRLSAYPRLAYATGKIMNPGSLADIGSSIEIDGDKVQAIDDAIKYVTPAVVSPDASNFQTELITTTRNLSNAGEAATGDIDAEKTSGRAILAIQRATQAPLNEQQDMFKAFWENVPRLWLSIWKANMLNGMEITYEDTTGLSPEEKTIKLSREMLKEIEADANVDITPTTAYDKNTKDLTLLDMFTNGMITLEELVDVTPTDSTIPKVELDRIIKLRKMKEKAMAEIQKKASQVQSQMNNLMVNQQAIGEVQEKGEAMALQGMQQLSGNATANNTGTTQ